MQISTLRYFCCSCLHSSFGTSSPQKILLLSVHFKTDYHIQLGYPCIWWNKRQISIPAEPLLFLALPLRNSAEYATIPITFAWCHFRCFNSLSHRWSYSLLNSTKSRPGFYCRNILSGTLLWVFSPWYLNTKEENVWNWDSICISLAMGA